jgi:hypothetical protein
MSDSCVGHCKIASIIVIGSLSRTLRTAIPGRPDSTIQGGKCSCGERVGTSEEFSHGLSLRCLDSSVCHRVRLELESRVFDVVLCTVISVRTAIALELHEVLADG